MFPLARAVRHWAQLTAAGAALAWCGCATRGPAAAAGAGDPLEELNLLSMPVAINLDQTPGPDGVGIKVYAVYRLQPKPQPIRQGALEVLMYEGALTAGVPPTLEPRRVWTYSAAELQAHEVKSSIGTGYDLLPEWGADRPSGDYITIVARYKDPKGGVVHSAPSSISLLGR